MKKLSRLLAILLSLALIISLCACTNAAVNDDDDDDNDSNDEVSVEVVDLEDGIIGEWEGEIDFVDFFNEGFMGSIDEEMAEYFEFTSFNVVLEFDFDDDGEASMAVEEDSIKKAVDSIKDEFKSGMTKYLEKMIADNGMDMTVDELCEAQGTTLDALIDEALSDKSVEDVFKNLENSGPYKVDDDKLYLWANASEIDEETYLVVEISDDEFEIVDVVAEDENSAAVAKLFKGATFNRVD